MTVLYYNVVESLLTLDELLTWSGTDSEQVDAVYSGVGETEAFHC